MVGHDGHRGWLYYVASDPDSRGSGFGRQMVQVTKVVSFYEHLGFEVTPRVVMAKWLDKP